MDFTGFGKGKESKQGFFAMYDGRGVPEPADYFKTFKQNYNRFAVAWNNQDEKFQVTVTTFKQTPERQMAEQAVFPGGITTETGPKSPKWGRSTGIRTSGTPSAPNGMGPTFASVDGVEVWQSMLRGRIPTRPLYIVCGWGVCLVYQRTVSIKMGSRTPFIETSVWFL